MVWVTAILGLLVGAVIANEEGAWIGFLAGFLLGREIGLVQRLRELEQRVALLRAAEIPAPPPWATPLAESVQPIAPAAPPKAAPAPPPPFDAPLPLELEFLREEAPANQAAATASGPVQPRPAPRQTSPWPDELPSGDQSMPLDDAIAWLKGYFTQGNPFVRIGVLILFFGVAFLLKYAAEQGMFPIELRLAGVALGGMAMLAAGWRLRLRHAGYGLVLQGGGIGLLYLTIFSGFQLYHLLPAELAFGLLVAMTAAAVALAVSQNAPSLALLGVTGGFLAPVLVSTGSGNHVALFSYYALLNAGIFGVAWYKAWRFLNLLGFLFTYGIATAWGVLDYRPDKFASTEPFLLLFFLLYLGIAVLFALRQPPRLRGYSDGALIFGNPLVAFSLQVALVREFEYGIACSAFGVGAIYLVLARRVWRQGGESLRPLAEAFTALGISFASIAIPFAVNNQWSSAAWALEGAGILWIGVCQQRLSARLFGLLLQLGAGLLFLADPPRPGDWLFLNGAWLGACMIALAGLFSAWVLDRKYRSGAGERLAAATDETQGHTASASRPRRDAPWERTAGALLLVWGQLWWYGGALDQFQFHLTELGPIQTLMLWAALSCFALAEMGHRWQWEGAWNSAQLLGVFLVLGAIALASEHSHPAAGMGVVAWPVAFGIYYLLLHQLEQWRPDAPLQPALHLAGGLLLVALLVWEGDWQLEQRIGHPLWRHWQPAWLALLPSVALALALRGGFWPASARPRLYLTHLGGALTAYLGLWLLWANGASAGGAPPLPYLPLLNPVELMQALALLLLVRWWLRAKEAAPQLQEGYRLAWSILGGLAFLFLTAALLRALHHWADIPYRLHALLASFLVQASLSIFWTLVAVGIMILATRIQRRVLWLVGSGLLALVVVKLFLIDLAAGGTLERIVSFVAVGLLLMLVGYFAPLPPRAAKE